MIMLTKHGGVVDAKKTRHRVASRYMSAEPCDANRNVKPKDVMASSLMTVDLIGEIDRGTDCMIGPWPSGRGPVIWK